MSTCRDCRRTIQWTVTEKGKAMPLDMVAADDGNVIFTGTRSISDRGIHGPTVHVLTKDEETDKPRFHSHHQTCPEGKFQKSVRSKARPPREAVAAPAPAPEPVQETLL